MKIKELAYSHGRYLAILILILPFLIYAHLLFSEVNSEFVFLNYSLSHWLNDNATFVWILLNDIIPFSLILIMFFTLTKKWKYFLIPLQVSYFLSILLTLDIFPTFQESIFSLKAILYGLIITLCILVFDRFIAAKYRKAATYSNLHFMIRKDLKLDLKLIQGKLTSLHAEKRNISLSHYFKKLFYLHFLIENNLGNIYNSKGVKQEESKNGMDIVLPVLIIFLTVLWYLPSVIPRDAKEFNLGGFIIDSNGFNDVRTFFWFLSRKFIVIVFLSIWFISTDHWWKYTIFSPLILFSFQFWEAFQDVNELDALSNVRVFPLVVLNIIIVIAISKWIKYRTDLLLVYEIICEEVEELLEEIKGEQLSELIEKYREIKEVNLGKGKEYYNAKLRELESEVFLKLGLKKV